MNFKRITMAKDLILLVVTKLIRLQLRQLPVTFWSNCQPVGFFFKRRRISGCHWFRRTSDSRKHVCVRRLLGNLRKPRRQRQRELR